MSLDRLPGAEALTQRAVPRLLPADDVAAWAATALVLGEGPTGPGICLIHRAERAGDRWSGQMALPGGKREAGDAHLAHTAARETREEVGLSLPAPLGRLPDIQGRARRQRVATYVFRVEAQQPLTPEPAEVQDARWVALADLLDPQAAVWHRWGGIGRFPAIVHGGQPIWGLTHRILETFAEAAGLTLPRPR